MSNIISRTYPYSPHAWGWTVDGVIDFYRLTVFPTRVGMDLGDGIITTV